MASRTSVVRKGPAKAPAVGIVMGSQSDWPTLMAASEILTALGVSHESRIVSAHRTPDRMAAYAKDAAGRGLKVIIAGAGGAAHLPGMIASMTTLPVLGVPVESRALKGLDLLLSIAQMPGGVPVATFAIGPAGAKNAGLQAAAILALSDAGLDKRLKAWRARQTKSVAKISHMIVKPGGVIGIIGGGQLGRMLALAAARLGLKTCIYNDTIDAPAFQVTPLQVAAPYDDRNMLTGFAQICDVITFEFENLPAEQLAYLAGLKPMHPGPRALQTTQDRLTEKTFIRSLGLATAPFAAVASAWEAAQAFAAMGGRAILKTRTLGYDGKGQAKVASGEDAAKAFDAFKGAPAILEGFVDFAFEASVVAARGVDGSFAAYDPPENLHENHILRRSTVPGRLTPAQSGQAKAIAKQIADALDYVGVLAVELFVGRDGALLINEIAPRVHNSGHWTIEACACSQFEQHIRAVAGWPLGDPTRHADAVMENIIGAEADAWESLARGGALHLYGKREARLGRKMGHVTRLRPKA